MGDSILDSLSLPPSGRAASKEPTRAKMADAGPSDDTQIQTETPSITPAIGVISSEDVPVMFSDKRALRDGGGTEGDAGKAEERKTAKPSGGIKRKQPDQSETDEEVEVDNKVRSEQGTRGSLGSFASVLKLDREREKDTNMLGTEDSKREDLGVKPLHEDLSLHFVSSLNRQPMILLDKLPVPPDSISESSRASRSPRTQWPPQRRQKPSGKPDSAFPASDNKE